MASNIKQNVLTEYAFFKMGNVGYSNQVEHREQEKKKVDTPVRHTKFIIQLL